MLTFATEGLAPEHIRVQSIGDLYDLVEVEWSRKVPEGAWGLGEDGDHQISHSVTIEGVDGWVVFTSDRELVAISLSNLTGGYTLRFLVEYADAAKTVSADVRYTPSH